MSLALCIAFALFQTPLPADTPWDTNAIRNIRPGTALLRNVLKMAYTKSRTFKALADEIERSRVVVFLANGQCDGNFASCLRLLAADDRVVSLRIVIDNFRVPGPEVAALLAHELEHAAEVARAGEVSDQRSMRWLFERLGDNHGLGYETKGAADVARIVQREIRSFRAR